MTLIITKLIELNNGTHILHVESYPALEGRLKQLKLLATTRILNVLSFLILNTHTTPLYFSQSTLFVCVKHHKPLYLFSLFFV